MARQPKTAGPKQKFAHECFTCKGPVTKLVVKGRLIFVCECTRKTNPA